jgi:hypothetical protein
MPRERLYLFDTTLRDGATRCSLPPCGRGMGRGVYFWMADDTPLPIALRAIDFPLRGGGDERRMS